MTEELKEKIYSVVEDVWLGDLSVKDAADKIADLINNAPIDIDAAFNEIETSHDRLSQALDEHLAIVDEVITFVKANM